MSIAEKLTTIAENQQAVYDAGKQAEYDAFWDVFQNYGNSQTYASAFSSNAWTDENYNPKYTFKVQGNNNMFASNTKITDTKVPIDMSENTGQVFYVFQNASKLVTIRKLIVKNTQGYSKYFDNCTSLQNIEFEGVISKNIDFQYSPLLSKASIENIVSCLSATSTGTTLTLSQTAVDNAFTTDEWNALIADKTNWTFSLV